VTPGLASGEEADAQAVADATLQCLRRTVPAAVPGITFLSGGQSDEAATVHLDTMNRRGEQAWPLTFSFGRALLAPTITEWAGDSANVASAQAVLRHRAKCNGAASLGRYDAAMEAEPAVGAGI
jgi:fructose-bisphosphate aldolase class I